MILDVAVDERTHEFSVADSTHGGAAIKNVRSPIAVRERKMLESLEARNDERYGMSATGVSMLDM